MLKPCCGSVLFLSVVSTALLCSFAQQLRLLSARRAPPELETSGHAKICKQTDQKTVMAWVVWSYIVESSQNTCGWSINTFISVDLERFGNSTFVEQCYCDSVLFLSVVSTALLCRSQLSFAQQLRLLSACRAPPELERSGHAKIHDQPMCWPRKA